MMDLAGSCFRSPLISLEEFTMRTSLRSIAMLLLASAGAVGWTGCDVDVKTDSPPPVEVDVDRTPAIDVDVERKPGGVDVDVERKPGGIDVDVNRK
jgi:hypothetical protein